MNAFGSALNLGFMRRSGDFSSGSMPMDSISRLHSHEFKFLFPSQWTQSQDAFPWVQVPISLPMNLWMLEFKFLFPCQWISGCLSSSPYSLPMNSRLRLHSHEFLFPANGFKTQTAFPWVPISLPNFWSLLVGYHPCPAILIQNVPIEAKKIAFWRDLRGTPIHTTWVPLKSIVERFRCLLRDFCFWANFSIFRFEKILIFDA